jgi:hypothetical protein
VRRHPIPLLLTTTALAALAGCGVKDPYAGKGITGPQHPPPTTATTPRASPPLPRQAPMRPDWRPSPAERTAAAYTTAQGNYSPRSYRRQYRAMVALTSGALRRELTRTPLAVLARGIDQAGASAATTVLATTLEPGQGPQRTATVAARQTVRTTSEAGRPGREYIYYRATLRRGRGGWRVVRFEPTR